ncbi:MAG: transglycosylase SLT domain-containing protein [Ruegeria sp.]
MVTVLQIKNDESLMSDLKTEECEMCKTSCVGWSSLRTLARVFAIVWLILNSRTGLASNICDEVAFRAARATGVPLQILQAITRVETGRKMGDEFEPWPWVINLAGEGFWLETREAALKLAEYQVKRGRENFDVGCFQVNYRWHGNAFENLSAMFDPDENALYAAKFLVRLYGELKNWDEAVGAYHSRKGKYAARYKIRFRRIYASLDRNGIERPPMSPRSGNGNFISTPRFAQRTPGSLVSLSADGQIVFLRAD